MLGVVSKKGCEREWLERFRRLAHTGVLPKGKRGHRDGWGMGYFVSGEPEVVKEPEDASESALFTETLKRKMPTRLLVHLRHASHGPQTFENTHPFALDRMLFCHNGTIYMDAERRSDSYHFFESIVKASHREPLREAIVKTAEAMKKKYRYSSLCILLLTPDMLLAYRDYRVHRNYYTLYFAKRKDALLVASERLDRERWMLLENGELLTVYNDLTYERGFYAK